LLLPSTTKHTPSTHIATTPGADKVSQISPCWMSNLEFASHPSFKSSSFQSVPSLDYLPHPLKFKAVGASYIEGKPGSSAASCIQQGSCNQVVSNTMPQLAAQGGMNWEPRLSPAQAAPLPTKAQSLSTKEPSAGKRGGLMSNVLR
uniref:Uncharacterized protein n=1 Tax=Buteo japonicus TaxID=224669 RepID=A0A8C0BUC2_9AVES